MSAGFYQKETKKGLKKACERHQDLCEKEKNKKH